MSEKKSKVKKISVSLSAKNFETLQDLEGLAGFQIQNRSLIINKALDSLFKCSFQYIKEFNNIGVDDKFIHSYIPLHADLIKVLKELEKEYGVQKLAIFINYVLYSKLINMGQITIGKVAELDELNEMMKKLSGKLSEE